MHIQGTLKALWLQIIYNWKTSLAGLVSILLTQSNALFGWNLKVETIITMIGTIVGIALILSRDANITSEGTKVSPARLQLSEEIDRARIVTVTRNTPLTDEKRDIAEKEIADIEHAHE